MAATSTRTLQLLSLLQARRYWPGAELLDRVRDWGRRFSHADAPPGAAARLRADFRQHLILDNQAR